MKSRNSLKCVLSVSSRGTLCRRTGSALTPNYLLGTRGQSRNRYRGGESPVSRLIDLRRLDGLRREAAFEQLATDQPDRKNCANEHEQQPEGRRDSDPRQRGRIQYQLLID